MNEPKFNKPLNTWIEEDIPVQSKQFIPDPDNPSGGRITTVTKMEKQRTMYINAPKEKYRCRRGEHVFRVRDKHKWIFSCTICPYSFKAYPGSFKFEDGKLIRRETGLAV